jgi:hypothetical protein
MSAAIAGIASTAKAAVVKRNLFIGKPPPE